MKISLAIILIVIALSNGYAVRPINTEDPPTVGKGAFSIESGINYDNKKPSYDLSLLYGLKDELEFSVKNIYLEEDYSFECGFHIKYDLSFLTLKTEYLKNFGSYKTTLSISASKYIYLSEKKSFFSSLGYSFNNREKDNIFYSLASSFDFNKKILYLDLYFESLAKDIAIFNKHKFTPLVGFGYSISDNIILDIGYMVESFRFKKESDNYIIGLTINF